MRLNYPTFKCKKSGAAFLDKIKKNEFPNTACQIKDKHSKFKQRVYCQYKTR